LVEAARQRAIGGGTRQRIGREGARSAAKHVARKLIEQKHERERTLGAVLPVSKFAIRGRLMGRQKPRPDGSIEVVVLREPFVVSGVTPERHDLRGRCTNRHCCGSSPKTMCPNLNGLI